MVALIASVGGKDSQNSDSEKKAPRSQRDNPRIPLRPLATAASRLRERMEGIGRMALEEPSGVNARLGGYENQTQRDTDQGMGRATVG
jgi:hypothetical protein